jgi:hypothetical protein
VGWVPEEAPSTALIRRGAAAAVMGAGCPSGGEHGDGGLSQRGREVGDKVFFLNWGSQIFLDISLFSFSKMPSQPDGWAQLVRNSINSLSIHV